MCILYVNIILYCEIIWSKMKNNLVKLTEKSSLKLITI